jgi:hypothetical protein
LNFLANGLILLKIFRPQLQWQALNEDATRHLGNKSDQRKLLIALVPYAKAFKSYNGKWEMAAKAYRLF